MSVDREKLKLIIDQISDQDALEVYDFVGYLKMKKEREADQLLNIEELAEDAQFIGQIEKSRKDRELGRIYGKQKGLDYLQKKVEEFEREQNI